MSARIYNKIENVVTVLSIVTVLHTDLSNTLITGESHDFPEIYYVEQGNSEAIVDGISLLLNAGSLMIYGPNVFHGTAKRHIPGGIVDIISFEVNSNILDPLYNRPIKLNVRQRERFETLIAKGRSLLEITDPQNDTRGNAFAPNTDLREIQQLKNLLELFLLEISQSIEKEEIHISTPNQEQIYRQQMECLTNFLKENLDRNLTLKEMESALWISEASLRRLVQRYKDCGPVAYFHELKIREAKHLIRTTDLSMTEISNRLGFSSLHYFSRLFREKTGSSPTEYRRFQITIK